MYKNIEWPDSLVVLQENKPTKKLFASRLPDGTVQ